MSKKDKLIVELVVANNELRDTVYELRKYFSQVYQHLVCVGGPFNDNFLKFTKEQLAYLYTIKEIAEENYE